MRTLPACMTKWARRGKKREAEAVGTSSKGTPPSTMSSKTMGSEISPMHREYTADQIPQIRDNLEPLAPHTSVTSTHGNQVYHLLAS